MGEHDVKLHSRSAAPGYGEDWAAWIDHHVELLLQRRFDEMDVENLADEVGSLSRSNFKAWVSAIRLVVLHMLKWDYQPEYRTRSWQTSINIQRKRIALEIGDNPSYRRRIEEAVEKAYGLARDEAAAETELYLKTFPVACPYDWTEITTRDHPLPGDDA